MVLLAVKWRPKKWRPKRCEKVEGKLTEDEEVEEEVDTSSTLLSLSSMASRASSLSSLLPAGFVVAGVVVGVMLLCAGMLLLWLLV